MTYNPKTNMLTPDKGCTLIRRCDGACFNESILLLDFEFYGEIIKQKMEDYFEVEHDK